MLPLTSRSHGVSALHPYRPLLKPHDRFVAESQPHISQSRERIRSIVIQNCRAHPMD
jgi:hypothetical protein